MAEENIPGIHNYCDRWCERCLFTGRCAVYATEANMPSEKLDLKNKLFWERLSDNFSKAKNLLEQAAQNYGVELNAVQDEFEKSEKKKKIVSEQCGLHPLSQLSLQYSALASEWLKTQPGMLDRLDSLKAEVTLGTQSHEGAKEETVTIKDGLAVIQWYSSFIHIKLNRALMGKFSAMEETENQQDFDGSAKIALLGINRSMQAWISLFEILSDKEDDFLKILSLLEKLKTLTKKEFPGAETFVRPGFDEN